MTAHRFVDYRVDADGVAVLRWNRPDARNALLPEMTDEAMAALDEAASDDTVRALVLSGAGDAFSAGADLKLMGRGDRLGGRRSRAGGAAATASRGPGSCSTSRSRRSQPSTARSRGWRAPGRSRATS